jgi:hypothetical protein
MGDWDWDSILSSVIQLAAAIIIYKAAKLEWTKKKGTKRQRRPRKRK